MKKKVQDSRALLAADMWTGKHLTGTPPSIFNIDIESGQHCFPINPALNSFQRISLAEISHVFSFLVATDVIAIVLTCKWTERPDSHIESLQNFLYFNESLWWQHQRNSNTRHQKDFVLMANKYCCFRVKAPGPNYVKYVTWLHTKKKEKSIQTKSFAMRQCVAFMFDPLVFHALLFVALKADGEVQWSVWVVLVPVWALHIVLLTFLISILRVSKLIKDLFSAQFLGFASASVVGFLSLLFFVLISVKYSFNPSICWSFIFLPIWIIFSAGMVFIAGMIFQGNFGGAAISISIWSPFLAFVVLFVKFLSGAIHNLVTVMIPLWVTELFLTILLTLQAGVAGAYGGRYIGLMFFVPGMCTLLVMVVYELLLCFYSHQIVSAVQAFSPLFIFFGIKYATFLLKRFLGICKI